MDCSAKKKYFNFRPILFLFVLCMLSIYFSFKVTLSPVFAIFYAIPLAYLVYLLVKRKHLALVITSVILLVTSLSTIIFVSSYKDASFGDAQYVISAKIDKSYSADGCYCIILTSAKAVDDSGRERAINGNIISFIYGINDDNLQTIKEHTLVVFTAKISGTSIVQDGEITTYYLKNNIKYLTNGVSVSNIANMGDDSSIIEQFRDYNKELLISTFGEYLGNIAFASMYGDKQSMDKDFISFSSTAGIAHIFAVSGLHVGLFVFLLNFIFGKTRMKEWLRFLLNLIFLLGFCVMFSFSQSTIRASIMALTVLLARLFSREYDPINAISLSGVIILLFRPLAIFELGFCMSFASVFGILLLYRTFSKLKINNKALRVIYLSIATTLAAEIGLLPIYSMFGYFPTWSLLSNLIILPIFTIGYTSLFAINALVLIMPFLRFAYIIPKAPYAVVAFLTTLVSKLPYATLPLFTFALPFTIIYFLAIYITSHLVKIKPKYKLAFVLPIIAFIVLSTIIINIPLLH